MMGFVTPGDQKVSVTVRDWDGMRRALWRSRHAWEIAMREATGLIARCAHMEGCPAKTDEKVPCLPDCPDRELRMSALVILSAARQFAPLDARRQADGPYYAPSREGFSETMAELGACQVEIGVLRTLEKAVSAWEEQEVPEPMEYVNAVLEALEAVRTLREAHSTERKPVDTIAAPQLKETTT